VDNGRDFRGAIVQDEQRYWTAKRRGVLTRRRLLATGGASLATAALAACASAPAGSGGSRSPSSSATAAGGTPKTGGAFNVFEVGGGPTLDALRTTSYLTLQPEGGVYSRLLKYKTAGTPQAAESGELDNDAAVSAESTDAQTWTFKLRNDVKWHDVAPVSGRALDSSDIKASFTRALDKANPNRGSLDMVDPNQISTPDAQTVVFKLNYPYAPFNHTVANPLYAYIQPKEALAGGYDPAKLVIGSGPWLWDNYTPDVAYTLKRNPDWFGRPGPYADNVRYAIIPDVAQQEAQFTAGNLDELPLPVHTDLSTVQKENPKAIMGKGDPNGMYALVGQLGDSTSLWTDVRVRHAFSMALNRDNIGAAIYNGDYVQQAVEPLSLGRWALKPSDLSPSLAQNYKFDPQQAKQLLQAAGAADMQWKLVYTPNGYGQQYQTLGETANSMLNAAGIKTNLINVDYNKDYVNGGKGYRYGYYPKDTIVFGVATGGYITIDEFVFAYYDSKSDRRNTMLNDPALDAMIDKARQQVKEEDQLKAYLDIQRYLVDKMYFVTGWPGSPTYTFVQPWVKNYGYHTTYGFLTETYAKSWIDKS
jgi:peptide/nickel transport system substrate-binding protein